MRSLLLIALLGATACRYTDVDTRWGLLEDADGDGFLSDVDCDDDDADVFPGADEVCNGKDDNCDGEIDVDAIDATVWYVDGDGDGFGDPLLPTISACEAPEGYVANDDDCDDEDDGINPDATEIPGDDIDQTCSGHDGIWCTLDADGDGFGDMNGDQVVSDTGACSAADNQADNALDCDDTDDTVFPGAPERCDGIVNTCGGTLPVVETDQDGDGHVVCVLDGPWKGEGTKLGGDCDDTNAFVYPDAPLRCDGYQNDCDSWDGPGDPGTLRAVELDGDDDGFVACTFAEGVNAGNWGNTEAPPVVGGGDCDAADGLTYPGAPEICDGKVNTCGGTLPIAETDVDGDDFVACTLDRAWQGASLKQGGDCDDGNGFVYPEAPDRCDGFQNDCDNWDGPGDPGTLRAVELDGDDDGYVACTFAVGVTAQLWGNTEDPAVIGGDDCEPADGTIYPGAPELCDGKVNTCGGTLPANEIDNDDDGYVECVFADGVNAGNWANVEVPAVVGGGDCDDGNVLVFPGAAELCDGLDNNCVNGTDDEDGKVTFYDPSGNGSWEDLSGSFAYTATGAGGSRTTVNLGAARVGTLYLCKGFYRTSLVVSSADIAIVGRYGAAVTTLTGINAGGQPSAVNVTVSGTGEAQLTGLTLLKGSKVGTGGGGGLSITGTPDVTVSDVVIAENIAERGGGVYVGGGTLTLQDVTLRQNTAEIGGGGLWIAAGTVDVEEGVVFDRNAASVVDADGGAIYMVDGSLTVNGASFAGNTADRSGGAIYQLDGSTTILGGTTFDGNSAEGGGGQGGGAVALIAGKHSVEGTALDPVVFTENEATDNDGGAYLLDGPGAELSLTHASFTGNTASDWGGAIACHDVCTIDATNTTFSGNSAQNGGAILVNHSGAVEQVSTITLDGCTLHQNEATEIDLTGEVGGGGIACLDVCDVIATNDTLFSENTAQDGAGMLIFGDGSTVSLDATTFTENAATWYGGGIACSDSCFVEATGSSLFTLNTATDGGAVFLGSDTSILDLVASDIEDNDALDWGGGVACVDECAVAITDGYFSGNSAMEGGAVYFHVAGSTFDCIATSNGIAGVVLNTLLISMGADLGPRAAGVHFEAANDPSATILTSQFCDWGATARTNDNVTGDIAHPTFEVFNTALIQNFACTDAAGCNVVP